MKVDIGSDKILKGSISSAAYSLIFQVVFRFISFGVNGLCIKNIENEEVLGIINVRLYLLFTTILFISREAFRRACVSNTRSHNWPQVVNLLWVTVPSMIFWSTIFCYIWLNWLELPADEMLNDYKFAVVMTGVGCVTEAFVEPLCLFAQAFQYVKLKLVTDLGIVIVRISSFALTVAYAPQYAIKAFAYGGILGSTVMVVFFTVFFFFEFRTKRELLKNRELHKDDPRLALPFDSLLDFLPRRIQGQSFIGMDLALLTWGFFKQGILKQILTEGERYIMTIFSVLTFAEQGIYDVINNLGSTAARFLFLPIEESSYFYFAQMLHRDKPVDQQPKNDKAKAALVLYALLKGISLLGLIIIVFGFSYSHLILSLFGQKLTGSPGPSLLRAHCICVLLMGVNGVTEAYVFAAMNKDRLDAHNRAMIGLTLVFLGLSWLLSRLLGGIGFILANCANMALRIGYSSTFIRDQNRSPERNPLHGLIPSKLELVALMVTFMVTAASEFWLYPQSVQLHLLVGSISGFVIFAAITASEPEFRAYLIGFVSKPKGTQSAKKNE